MARRIFPISAYPSTPDRTFPTVLLNNGRNIEGLGVAGSITSDASHDFVFATPDPVPGGTAKFVIWALSLGLGDAKLNVKWKSYGVGEDLFETDVSLNAEGTETINWVAGDAGDLRENKTVLDADTIVAGELIIVSLVFESTSWTLDNRLVVIPSIIWEA
jgi:hypothetical protein